MKNQPFKQKRKLWFRMFKQITRIKYKRPEMRYLGEKPTNGALILSNHVGAAAPLTLELYADFPIRMWGTYEMNSGLISLYRYQTKVYYHGKKRWNLHLARLFCLIASPLTNLYYKGLQLISTYRDTRFLKTVKESVVAIRDRKENLVIFPEMSEKGYFKELEGFYAGFVVLAQKLAKEGVDVPVYVCYFNPDTHIYCFDKPVLFSRLEAKCGDRYELAKHMLDRCNELGKLTETNRQKSK